MPAERKVSVNNLHPRLKCKAAEVRALYRFIDKAMAPEAMPEGELSVAIVDREEIIRLHEQFLADPTVTDVITFPGDPDEGLAGEIVVCADFAEEQAPKFGQSFAEELTLYLVHGWLHLSDYDDIAEADRPRMRSGEAKAMAAIRAAGLVPAFEWKQARRKS
jgi:probable rRNA maturation factor